MIVTYRARSLLKDITLAKSGPTQASCSSPLMPARDQSIPQDGSNATGARRTVKSGLTGVTCTCIQYPHGTAAAHDRTSRSTPGSDPTDASLSSSMPARLDVLGFDERGAIYQAIDKAYCAMHDLHMKLHYESCGHGVGRAKEGQPETNPPADRCQPPADIGGRDRPGRPADETDEPRRDRMIH